MIKLICLAILTTICTSCTYSVNLVHTQGEAYDIVDDSDSAQPDVSPSVEVPLGSL